MSQLENQISQYHEQRLYFSLIEKVGSWNKYQFYLFMILAMINLLQASLIFIAPYLFHTASYICQGVVNDECTNYVCSLPYQDRFQYKSPSLFTSLADDLGVDFNCEHSSNLVLFSTLVFVSSVSGMSIFTTFTQRFGRKNSLALSSSLILVGLVLTLLSGFMKSIPMVICSIIVTYWGTENSYQYLFCFSSQVVSEKNRILYINLLNIFYGIGMIANAILFLYVKQWKSIFIYYQCSIAIMIILSVFIFLQKTPIDLLSSQKQEEIIKTLQRIAQTNQKPFDITHQQVKTLKQRYNETSKDNSFTVIDLFKHKSIRSVLIPLTVLNFIAAYLFYSPAVITKDSGTDLFKQSIIQGVSYCTAVIFVYLSLQYIKRRSLFFLANGLMVVFTILLRVQDSNKRSVIFSICYFIFRMLTTMNFACAYTMNYEIFPTQVRAVGSTFVYLLGSLAGVIQPSIVSVLQKHNINVLNQFILIAVLSFIPIIFVKETFNMPPPQVIEELDEKRNANPVDI